MQKLVVRLLLHILDGTSSLNFFSESILLRQYKSVADSGWEGGVKNLLLPPANEVVGRYCFYSCLSVHGGRGGGGVGSASLVTCRGWGGAFQRASLVIGWSASEDLHPGAILHLGDGGLHPERVGVGQTPFRHMGY